MGRCLTPITKKNESGNDHVPCGKCPNCTARKVSAWSFRLMQHEKICESSYFITLTYDTKNVPITPKGFMEISKRDLQLFFKRLRKAHGDTNIKYYAVGEYGGRTLRPHYHIILFNAKLELIQPAWDLGHVHYGEVTGASIGYTLKYIHKKGKIPLHANDDRQPEFSLMSKKLGANYLTKAMVKWHRGHIHKKGKAHTARLYCVLEDGRKITMPRYYQDKIFCKIEKQLIAMELIKQMDAQALELQKNPDYFRNRLYSEINQFTKQAKLATKNDKI